jgi:lactate 2-monooxygenase
MPDFGAYQNEIYIAGLSGRLPRFPMRFDDLEAKAHAAMPQSLVSYVAGGCGDEQTQEANVAAFDKWGLIPRMFVGAKRRDLSVELFGMKLPSPLFMTPNGVIGLCAQDGHGDLATARAAALTGVPMVASTLSVDPLEAVAAEFKGTPGFFQLYTPTDRELAASLVRRAEQAGFKAIVVTLDTWVTGWRPRDLATANFPQLRGHCLANYFTDPRFAQLLGGPPEKDSRAAVTLWAAIFGNPLTWDDLPAALADQTAADRQGYMPSRRRPARHRRRRRWNLLLQSRRPAGERRRSGARHAARGGEGRRRDTGPV